MSKKSQYEVCENTNMSDFSPFNVFKRCRSKFSQPINFNVNDAEMELICVKIDFNILLKNNNLYIKKKKLIMEIVNITLENNHTTNGY